MDSLQTENTLTIQDSISYLIHEGSEIMEGTVRARGKCPVCQGAFTQIPKLGFICTAHQTTPKRYFVDFYQKRRFRLFSDRHGQILDSYQRASNLLARVNSEIKNHTFDPANYLKCELEKYYISTLLDGFLESKLTGNDPVAPSYQSHYKRYVGIAKEHFRTEDVRDIRKLDIINYQSYVRGKYNFSDKTLKNCLDIFKTFIRYVRDDLELIKIVPSFPEISIPLPNTTWLPHETQKAVFSYVPDQDKPIIAFLMLSGCRPSEARALKCGDVDLDNGMVTISATFSNAVYRKRRKGRKSKPLTIPIHKEIFGFIKDRVENNLPEAFVFTSSTGNHYSKSILYRMWNSVREKSGLDKSIRLYEATRHSFASQLINSNVSIYSVSHLLGHSNIKTTEKYLKCDSEKLKVDISNLSLDRKVIKLSDTGTDKALDKD